MELTGRWLSIQCFKHNGSLHRVWDRGLVLDNNDDYIVVASKKAKVVEYNGRCWFTKEPAVTIFSKKEWWNAICMFKKDGICFYCNIASPTLMDKESIKYIDYDLDAKLFPDGEIKVLDEKEYVHHKMLYHYNDELDEVLKYQTKVIVERMEKREFPFNDELIRNYFDQFLQMIKRG